MMRCLQIIAAALTAWFMLGSPAHADYRFCNKTSYVLDGAIAFEANGQLKSQGWVRVLPGDCASALQGDIAEQDYFVFARSIDAHAGRVKYFSGNTQFCTLEGDFDIAGADQCALRGYDSADFLRVPTKAGRNWSTTFAEASEYTDDQARIAAAQRLLKDNGFALNRVDGIAARNTLRAVEAFQRSANVAVTGKIDSTLIGQLVERAVNEQKAAGLDLCNKTNTLVWAAIGYKNGEDDMSSGWVRIEPGNCRKAIKGKLDQDAYYVYAEGVDDAGAIAQGGEGAMIWSGSDSFCIKTTRFEIKGRERCAARGFDERGFMRFETEGKPLRQVDFD